MTMCLSAIYRYYMSILSTVAPDVTNIDNKLQVERVDLQTSTVDISFPVSKVDAYLRVEGAALCCSLKFLPSLLS